MAKKRLKKHKHRAMNRRTKSDKKPMIAVEKEARKKRAEAQRAASKAENEAKKKAVKKVAEKVVEKKAE